MKGLILSSSPLLINRPTRYPTPNPAAPIIADLAKVVALKTSLLFAFIL